MERTNRVKDRDDTARFSALDVALCRDRCLLCDRDDTVGHTRRRPAGSRAPLADDDRLAGVGVAWAEDMVAVAKNISAFNAGNARDCRSLRVQSALGTMTAASSGWVVAREFKSQIQNYPF